MTRFEFTDSLRRALSGKMSSAEVNDNVRYYEDYIDSQIRSGKSEEETLTGLGDPRLIAKTIIEADKHAGEEVYRSEFSYSYDGERGETIYSEDSRETEKSYRIPAWVVVVIGIVLVMVVIGLVTSLLSVFLPIVLPVLCVVMIIRFFQRRR